MKARCRPKVSTDSVRTVLTYMRYDKPMSELGKVKERHGIDMNFYLLPCKAETGLNSDRLPQVLLECTPVEIKNSVVETGNHKSLVSGSSRTHKIPTTYCA